MINKKAQIWIETVLYTLIGLALIGLVLAFVMPRVNESKDKLVVDQSISSLNSIDKIINEIWLSPGNQRPITLTVKRGELSIDSQNDLFVFTIDDLNKPFSQPETPIAFGKIVAISHKGPKLSSITLTLNYSGQVNITYNGMDSPIVKKFTAAPLAYRITLSSKGDINGNGLFVVDAEV